jgi:hypothetical protein
MKPLKPTESLTPSPVESPEAHKMTTSNNSDNHPTADTPPNMTPAPKAGVNKFDLSSVRLSQDYAADHGVEKVITNVPIQRSKKGTFFRVHSGDEFQLNVATLEIKGDTAENYLLTASVLGLVPDMEKPVTLRLAVDKNGNPFLISVPLPSSDGRRNSWSDSLAEAVKIAETKWVRTSANMNAGCYNVHVATALIDEPVWPNLTFGALLEIAFRGRIISSPDHLVLRQLMGLA